MGQSIDEIYLPTTELTEDEKKEFLDTAIARAKEQMDSWQAWYSVALAYDLLKERKLARQAMQYSIELFQAAKPK
jgi:phenylpropionate dioxygenase-like ring-hydroxylating dioxygenase large terminal subunit